MKEPLRRLKDSLQNKWVKWLALALVLLVVTGFAISAFFFQPWLRNKLETETREKSDGLYSLHMAGLSASLLACTLTIDSLALVPDTAAWQQMHQQQKSELTSRLSRLQARRLKLTGVNYLGLLFKEPLKLNRAELLEPVLHIDQMREDTTASKPLHQGLEGPLATLKIGKLRIRDGAFSYKKDSRHKYNAAEVSGLNLELSDLKLDSASYTAEDRIFYARKVAVSGGKSNFLLPRGFNRLKTGPFSLDSDTKEVKLKDMALIPVYKPAELARRRGEAASWIDMRVAEVVLQQADLGKFSRNGSVVVGEMNFERPRLKVFKDKHNFRAKKTRPLPHDLVQQFKSGLAIEKITIRNLGLRYDELAEGATTPGHFALNNLYATITNVTNNKERISAKKPAVAHVGFNLMGKGRLDCTIRMALLDPNCFHTITGKVGKTDLTVLNPIMEPAHLVSFKSGTVQDGTFNFKLYRNTATGTMKLNYTNFEIDLLSQAAEGKEEKKQSFPKKVLSKIANKAVVKEENTPGGDGLRTAEIKVSRQQKRSVFTYWKDCLEQGLLVSAGLGKFQPSK